MRKAQRSQSAAWRIGGIINPHLRPAGAEPRETGTDGGYPVFSIGSTRTARARQPKNLILATLAKPDIPSTDAVNNYIEIVENADKLLVYDRHIGVDGPPLARLASMVEGHTADHRR